MTYENMEKALFLSRPNRFIAICKRQNCEEVICHVKNTGRCRELLIPGKSEVFIEKSNNENRKTKYDLISVLKNGRLINMDSQIPNAVAEEGLLNKSITLPGFENITFLKREKTFGNSRFDIYIENGEKKAFVEVKGCTLEEDGVCMFPDAPTLRGVKHIFELIKTKEEGFDAFIIFVIQMKNVKYFTPNYKTHKEFGEALKIAKEKGVNILAFDCNVSENSITINKPVNIIL
ncbi:MAG: DNA/RNA nuclease SfsA [Clostridia bacterium]|nr:DNA/RNA nuclease SfsA [Clostridia bacterium]